MCAGPMGTHRYISDAPCVAMNARMGDSVQSDVAHRPPALAIVSTWERLTSVSPIRPGRTSPVPHRTMPGLTLVLCSVLCSVAAGAGYVASSGSSPTAPAADATERYV